MGFQSLSNDLFFLHLQEFENCTCKSITLIVAFILLVSNFLLSPRELHTTHRWHLAGDR